MATEHFRILAVNETHCWDESIIRDNQFEAAFGLYLIREREATHVCSLTPSTFGDWLQNAFVFDHENTVAESAVESGELEHEGDSTGSYFPYVDLRYQDMRFVGDRITVKIDSREFGGLKSDAYHTAIWDAAREEATSNGGAYEPKILWHTHFRQYQAEQLAKRHAENRKPLATPMLELFAAAAEREGFYNYEGARAQGWL